MKIINKAKKSNYPSDWEIHKIRDICILSRGRVISQEEIDANPGPYPVYSSQSRNGGEMGRINSYDFDGEYVTWTTDGEYAGTTFYRNGKFNCTNVCGVLKSKNKNINMAFLSYFLGTQTKRFVTSAGNPKLMNNTMSIIPVALPPLPEQQKIVYVLDTIQEAIGVQEKIIEKTKELKRTMMNLLFHYGTAILKVKEFTSLRVGELTSEEFEKLTGPKLKKTEIGEIPESWEVVKLGDRRLFEIKLGGTPSTLIEEYWNGNVPLITPNDLSNLSSSYIRVTERNISYEGLRNGSTLLPEDSIILSTRAPIGYVAILSSPMAFNQGCKGIVILKKDMIDKRFLYYFLTTKKEKLNELGSGSTFRELSTSDLKNFAISLPPLPEQREIADILQTIDQKIEIEEKKKALYEELFKAMLDKLMTGEIRVNNIDL